ncbi:MAG: hypothetical protein H7274_07495 [Rhodoferax sp.]|nr:hypothetical protein [Rhodoferax sp.]
MRKEVYLPIEIVTTLPAFMASASTRPVWSNKLDWLYVRTQSEAALRHFAAFVRSWSGAAAAIIEIDTPLLTVKLLI